GRGAGSRLAGAYWGLSGGALAVSLVRPGRPGGRARSGGARAGPGGRCRLSLIVATRDERLASAAVSAADSAHGASAPNGSRRGADRGAGGAERAERLGGWRREEPP